MSLALRKKVNEPKAYSARAGKKAKSNFLVELVGLACLSFGVSSFLSLAFSFCLRASMTSDSFACTELQRKINLAVEEGESLEKKAAVLSSPARVEKIALKKLKMVKPEKVYFIQLEDEGAISYSFRKPMYKSRTSSWLDSFLDNLNTSKTDKVSLVGNR